MNKSDCFKFYLKNVIFETAYIKNNLQVKKINNVSCITNPCQGENIEDDGILFYCSLRLALPSINIRIKGLPIHQTHNIVKYGSSISKGEYIYVDQKNCSINRENIKNIEDWHKLYVDFSKRRKNIINNNDINFYPVVFAEYQYSQACESITVEESIMYLYSALEALCCSPGENINDIVSRIISVVVEQDKEKRKKLYAFLKTYYKIRSRQIHGDFKDIVNTMKKLENAKHDDDKYIDNVYYKL